MEEVLKFLRDKSADFDGTTRPGGWRSEDGDCFFYFHESTPYKRERVDELLTLYRADDDNRIIGLQVKGLARLLKDHDLIHIMVQRGEIEVVVLLLVTFQAAKETSPSRAEQYYDAISTISERGGSRVPLNV